MIYTAKGAEFDSTRLYRPALWRGWDERMGPKADMTAYKFVLFIGLNPSTATAVEDDPTIRREVDFTASWGFNAYVKCNLFAIRATDPKAMLEHPRPVGRNNDERILYYAQRAKLIVAAWGAHGSHLERDYRVSKIIAPHGPIMCFGRNADGSPRHPLYLKKTTQLERFA